MLTRATVTSECEASVCRRKVGTVDRPRGRSYEWKEIRLKWGSLFSAAPAVITNPDLSMALPSGEGYISLTIQSLARQAQVSQMLWRCQERKKSCAFTDWACFLTLRASLQPIHRADSVQFVSQTSFLALSDTEAVGQCLASAL